MLKTIYKKIFLSTVLIGVVFSLMLFIVYNEYYSKDYYTKITYDQLDQSIKSNKAYIFFYKTDCIPCSKFKKKLNEYIKSNKPVYPVKAINIGKTDIDESIIEKYRLKMSPTFIFFKNDKEIERLEGNESVKNLKKFFKNTTKY